MIILDFQTTTKKTKTILTKHDKKRQTEQKNFSTKIQFDDLHNSTTITNRTNTYGQQQQIHTLVNTFNAKDLIHAQRFTQFLVLETSGGTKFYECKETRHDMQAKRERGRKRAEGDFILTHTAIVSINICFIRLLKDQALTIDAKIK